MVFDAATGVILVCTAVCWRTLPPLKQSLYGFFAGVAAIVAAVLVARFAAGAAAALEMASAVMLAAIAVALGRELLIRQSWPTGAFIVATAAITATGTYWRAHRFEEVLAAPDRQLQPDVRYYQQQALRTANPFAAGLKSPLWSALHAPIVRHAQDRDAAMRVLSWVFGILMLPIVALSLGRLFEPLVGVIVAALLAVLPWLVDLCAEGLREELGVCLWVVVLALLFDQSPVSWSRAVTTGVAVGILLLLRNIAAVPLILLMLWCVASRRWPMPRALCLLISIALVIPFYVNQWLTFGDPFALEKRDARYHANSEFSSRPPPGLSMPAARELEQDQYAGEPLSPLSYLVRFRTSGQFLYGQWTGIARIFTGVPFASMFSEWLRLACSVGLIAAAVLPRTRFAPLFVLGSIIGIPAHLSAIGNLEVRLLLPVLVIWLAAGFSLIAAVIRLSVKPWYCRQLPQ